MERDLSKPHKFTEEVLRERRKEREDRFGLTKIHAILEEKARKKEEALHDQVALDRAEWEGMPGKHTKS